MPLPDRHARQTVLPEIGPGGQARLAAASVLVIGAGGLGCPALQYLAAAGVGRLGIVDPDRVSLSNLQRQILFEAADEGHLKTDRAHRRLKAFHPGLRIDTWPVAFAPDNADEILAGFDVVVDGTDNFQARYRINDACRRRGLALVHGSVLRFAGQVTTLLPNGPCYRCLFPEPPTDIPSCADAGVLGAVPGVIGSLLAAETVKILLGCGVPLRGRLLIFDALAARFREYRYDRDPACPVCAGRTAPDMTAPSCPTPSLETPMKTLDVQTLAHLLPQPDAPFLLDVREAHEVALCRIPGAVHIPMGDVPTRLAEIPRDREVVVQCHHGGRSARIATLLLASGYTRVSNLTGGIHAWAEQIDPGMCRY